MGIRVLKWSFVSVCILCIHLAGCSRVARDQEMPQHNDKIMRVRLMHRNDHDSPFRKQDTTRLDSLRSLHRQDNLHLTAFSTSKHCHNPETEPKAKAEAEDPVEFTKPDPGTTIRAPIFSGSLVGSGEYFVELHIGTPPKRFLLIADTGSDLVWVNCRYNSKTRRRNSTARLFDAGSSSSFTPVSCTAAECLLVPAPAHAPCSRRHPSSCKYKYSYANGTAFSSGVYAFETLTIYSSSAATSNGVRKPGGVRIPGVAMGCSTRRHGQSFEGADGVIGLGQGPISFPSQIGSLYGDKFSYCLASHLKGRNSTRSNYLVFGHRSLEHLKSGLQYTPFQKNSPAALDTFYYIGIEGVNINGKRLPIPRRAWVVDRFGNGGTIVDAGTTLTYLLEPGYGILLSAFEKLVFYPRLQMEPFDLCFNSSGIANPRVPEFSIDFAGGACFRPDVDNYFIEPVPDVKCLGILGRPSLFGVNAIGNIMQQNFFLEFDRRNSRLGFARTDCSKD